MGRLLTSALVVVLLAGCETTTTGMKTPNSQSAQSPTQQSATTCRVQYSAQISALDDQIAAMDAKLARGYRTGGSPVAFSNPLKVCKGIGPLARICLPSPEIQSTLPTHAQYRAMHADKVALEKDRDALVAKRADCS